MKSRLIFILLIMIYVMSAPGAWPARKADDEVITETVIPAPTPTPLPSADTQETLGNDAVKYSAEEKEMIAKVVFAEAHGETNEGQRAVVQVIINRVNSTKYKNTIKEVVHQRGQFVIANTYTEKEMNNVEFVLENGFDMPADVMYFGTWNFRKNQWGKIGNHYFMR